jgi:hypothetical protein
MSDSIQEAYARLALALVTPTLPELREVEESEGA